MEGIWGEGTGAAGSALGQGVGTGAGAAARVTYERHVLHLEARGGARARGEGLGAATRGLRPGATNRGPWSRG